MTSWRFVFTLNEQEELKLTDSLIKEFKEVLRKKVKHWCFQVELGDGSEGKEEGTCHLQGRVSVKKKCAKSWLIQNIKPDWNIYWDVEYGDTSKSSLYVTKEETRIGGPWSDEDIIPYIPRKIAGITMQGWQATMEQALRFPDDRTVHFVHDPTGGIGKSTFVLYMVCHYNAIIVPPTMHTADDMSQFLCSATKGRRDGLIFLMDLPRAIEKKDWNKYLAVLESAMGCILYDHRYKATTHIIEVPAVCVFTNTLPKRELLTSDRWKIHTPQKFDKIDIVELSDEEEDIVFLP